MEQGEFLGEGHIGLHMDSRRLAVATGGAARVQVLLRNQGPMDDFFELSMRGVPLAWISIPEPVTRLDPGQTRAVTAEIRVPSFPQAQPGNYRLVVRVMSQEEPEHTLNVPCTLTISREEEKEPLGPEGQGMRTPSDAPGERGAIPQPRRAWEGDFGLHLPSPELSVSPGETAVIPVVVMNRSAEGQVLELSVDGVPSEWVSLPGPVLQVGAGEQVRLEMAVQPPRSVGSRAGRYRVRIRGHSESTGLLVERRCTLTVGAFTEFSAELDPGWIRAGETGKISVDNEGNIQESFLVAWQSLNDELEFEPGPRQRLTVLPGQTGTMEFRARPRRRPLLGGQRAFPFTTQVQSSSQRMLSLHGEVLGRALVPAWLLVAALVLMMVCACAALVLLLAEEGLEIGMPGLAPMVALAIRLSGGEPVPLPTSGPGVPLHEAVTPGGDSIESFPAETSEGPARTTP